MTDVDVKAADVLMKTLVIDASAILGGCLIQDNSFSCLIKEIFIDVCLVDELAIKNMILIRLCCNEGESKYV